MDYTYTLQPGTKAVAQQVNKNFDDAKQAIDSLEVDVSNIETQLTGGFVLPDGSVDFTKNQSYKEVSITNATYATPIVITANNHPFVTGDRVYIDSVGGNTSANGSWTITRVDANSFRLDNSVGNAAYTSGGTVYRLPNSLENLINEARIQAVLQDEINPDIIALTTNMATTLTADRFHYGAYTSATTLTMPTVTTTDKLVVCQVEFTTNGTSYPSFSGIDNWDYGAVPTWSTTAKNLVTIYTHDGATFNANYRQIGT